jgi:hypothetical protein
LISVNRERGVFGRLQRGRLVTPGISQEAAPEGGVWRETNTMAAKPKAGRPSSFKPEYIEQARKLAGLGATDREAADFFNVAESTLYLWKHTQPDFSDALKVGKETADARVEQSLYRRALGYQHDATKIAVNAAGEVTTVPFVERFPPDTTAAIFWLKNRRPDEWRDVKASEHSGPNGGPIPIERVQRTIIDPNP